MKEIVHITGQLMAPFKTGIQRLACQDVRNGRGPIQRRPLYILGVA